MPGFDLVPLDIRRHQAEEPDMPIGDGLLFGADVSATGIHTIKRATADARARVVADIVTAEPNEPWIIWVDTDYEGDAIAKVLQGAQEVRGSHSIERKENILAGFADGSIRIIVTKSSLTGFGLNWQHCARMVFAGRSFSYEQWYQAVRRCWRFGQTRRVQVHLVVAEGEDAIGRVIDRKADDHISLKAAMRAAIARAIGRDSARKVAYHPTHAGRLPEFLEYAR